MRKLLQHLLIAAFLFTSCKKEIRNSDTSHSLATSDSSNLNFALSMFPIKGLAFRDFSDIAKDPTFYTNEKLRIINAIVVRANWEDLQDSYNGPIKQDNDIQKAIDFVNQKAWETANDPNGQIIISLKIRVIGGYFAPAWVKNDVAYGGGSHLMNFVFPELNNLSGQVPRYWDLGYIDAYSKLMNQLAIKYSNVGTTISEVAFGIGDIITCEPFLLKAGIGLQKPSTDLDKAALYTNAQSLYLAGYTEENHVNAIKASIDIMANLQWIAKTYGSSQYRIVPSLCCNLLQNVTVSPQNPNWYVVSENLAKTEEIMNYFINTLGWQKGTLGNNGLRDYRTSKSPDEWIPGTPGGSLYQQSIYLNSISTTDGARPIWKVGIYYQTANANGSLPTQLGDFAATIDDAIHVYGAWMVEVPKLQSNSIPAAEKTDAKLKEYDDALESN